MGLHSFARGWRRCAKGLPWAIFALGALAAPVHAVDNLGLGPLSIRNQFPATLGFLTYTPDAPGTLPDSTVQLRYQASVSNTFVNTQSPLANSATVITATEAARGLTTADFPASGYGLYIDMETQRHLLRLDYGLAESLEVGLELAWLTFGGGHLDPNIESVERAFGGLNEDRPFSERNRFDFYVARDGQFLRATSQPGSAVLQDPVLNVKWNLAEGGAVLPALTLKLSYKAPLERPPAPERQIASSGGADYGYSLLFAKAVGAVVGHLQFATTRLEVAPNTFADQLTHRMFGLEFRLGAEDSLVLQSVTQSSIFIKTDDYTSQDFPISRPTDVFVAGYKHVSQVFVFELGTIEDYNQQRNEADITIYMELGWRW